MYWDFSVPFAGVPLPLNCCVSREKQLQELMGHSAAKQKTCVLTQVGSRAVGAQ